MSLPRKLGVIAFNLYFVPLFAFVTVICFIAFPLIFLATWPWLRRPRLIILWCIRFYGRLAMALCWPLLKTRVDDRLGGGRQLPGRPDGQWRPAIYVLNHGSWSDAYFVALLSCFNGVFAVRSWVFRIWVYRPFIDWAGYINAEEADWDILVNRCRERVDEGVSLLFFPEGHRTRDGNLQRFHGAPFHVATELGLDIVPVCVHGAFDFLGHHRRMVHPATVTMRILPAVSPEEFPAEGRALALRHYVRSLMESNLREIGDSDRN